MKFTKKQIERYSRQIILKKIGATGQKKLLKSSVLIANKNNQKIGVISQSDLLKAVVEGSENE